MLTGKPNPGLSAELAQWDWRAGLIVIAIAALGLFLIGWSERG